MFTCLLTTDASRLISQSFCHGWPHTCLRSFVLCTGFLTNLCSIHGLILLLTFDLLNNRWSTSCLSDLLLYVPSRQIRSSADTRLLRLPSLPLKFSGQRAFFHQAPLLWNNLPYRISLSEHWICSRHGMAAFLCVRFSVCVCVHARVLACVCVFWKWNGHYWSEVRFFFFFFSFFSFLI